MFQLGSVSSEFSAKYSRSSRYIYKTKCISILNVECNLWVQQLPNWHLKKYVGWETAWWLAGDAPTQLGKYSTVMALWKAVWDSKVAPLVESPAAGSQRLSLIPGTPVIVKEN